MFAPAAHPTLPGQMRKEGLKSQVLTVCGKASYRKRPPCQPAGYSSTGVMLLATHEKHLLSYNAKGGDRWDHKVGIKVQGLLAQCKKEDTKQFIQLCFP